MRGGVRGQYNSYQAIKEYYKKLEESRAACAASSSRDNSVLPQHLVIENGKRMAMIVICGSANLDHILFGLRGLHNHSGYANISTVLACDEN